MLTHGKFGSTLTWILVAAPMVHLQAAAPNKSLFSPQPQPSEITNAKIFEESLLSLGRPTPEDTKALAQALDAFLASRDREGFEPLLAYLEQYPNSPWKASLLANMACEYRTKGYFSQGISSAKSAWMLSKNVKTREGNDISSLALGEWAEWSAFLGLTRQAYEGMEEARMHLVLGNITEKLTATRETLRFLRENPETSLRCGPMALMHLKTILDPFAFRDPFLAGLKATSSGTNLAMNEAWAREAGMDLAMAKREPGSSLVAPAMVHMKVGHFAALLREGHGKYLVQDPALGQLWLSAKALDQEMSGYALIPTSRISKGWTAVSKQEGEQVWGSCPGGWAAGPTNPLGTQPPTCPPSGGASVGGDLCGCQGMPRYTFHNAAVSLSLADAPVGYAPPRGPRIDFQVNYVQRDVTQPQHFDYCNLGPKWTFNWLACLKEDTTNPSQNVTMCYPGGGGLVFKPLGGGVFAAENYTQAQLVKNSDGTFTLRYKDGTRQFFTIADRTTGVRRVILTKVVDKAGNVVQLNWDAKLRLVGIVDALGQTTTLSYELAADELKITRVTDPFGRSAQFQYNANGLLTSITDAMGMISTFSYGPTSESPTAPADFINAVTTPYGTTRFFMGESPDRWLEAEDPLGRRERLETGNYYYSILPQEPAPQIPEIPFSTGYSNTGLRHSMYWDKRAYANREKDYTKAHMYQWGYGPSGFSNGILISEKKPLESRVWTIPAGGYYDELAPPTGDFGASTTTVAAVSAGAAARAVLAPTGVKVSHGVLDTPLELKGPFRNPSAKATAMVAANNLAASVPPPGLPQTLISNYTGAINLVTRRARVLEDGSSQVFRYDYDLAGHMVQSVDPVGRITLYAYSGDNLTEVRNTTNGANDLLSTYTYNSLGLPLTVTDAAGQVTTYTYNAWGQPASIKNPKNETTTMVYDTKGFLQSITGSQTGSTTSFTYDTVGRVHTVTGPDGATLTTDYDNLDRPVKTTYSDGTTEEMVYDRLDLVRKKDRKGRWTLMAYNPLRQLVEVQDPQGRVTQFDWCGCGNQLEGLTDPMGRVTSWWRDLQGRVTTKRLDDGTQTEYAYDISGRLSQRTDAKGQKTVYAYNQDDALAQVSYPNALKPTPTVQYTYDVSYNRLATSQGGFGATTYSYYPITAPPSLGAGRLASVKSPFGNSLITYTYDALGRVQSRDINGVKETRNFDTLGRLNSVINPLGAFAYAYQGATGRLDHISMPNGQVTSFGYYDATKDFRLKDIKHAKSSATVISAFGYDYDTDGQIKTWSQQSDAALPNVYTFEYDAANQLTSAVLKGPTGSLIHQLLYGYDLSGNRTSEQIDGNVTTADYNNVNQVTTQRKSAVTATVVAPSTKTGN